MGVALVRPLLGALSVTVVMVSTLVTDVSGAICAPLTGIPAPIPGPIP